MAAATVLFDVPWGTHIFMRSENTFRVAAFDGRGEVQDHTTRKMPGAVPSRTVPANMDTPRRDLATRDHDTCSV